MENRTSKFRKFGFAKLAAALLVLLLLGVMASSALADGDPFSALDALTTSTATTTSTSADATSASSTSADTTGTSTDATTTTATDTTTDSTTTSAGSTTSVSPAITTDQSDYAPGSTVTLSGSGWGVGESVHLFVNDTLGATWQYNGDVTADLSGTFVAQFQLPNVFVSDYDVTATGEAGEIARVAFTDSQPQSVAIAAPATTTVSAGGAATYGNVTVSLNGNGNLCTVTLGLDTALPAGATAVFGNSPGTGNTTIISSFSITTSSSTPAGTYNVHVTATPGAGCQNGASTQTSNQATLIVAGKANQTITFAQPTTPQVYGSTFHVNPSSDSGLAVSLAATGVCTVAAAAPGFDVTMTSGSGNCVFTASQAGNASFNAATNVQRTVAAQTRPIIVAADPKTKQYGAADPALTFSVTSGSVVSGDSFTGTLSRVAGETVVGSPYAINQGTLALNANYTLTFLGANLTITARPITVTADPKTKQYGAADPALTFSVTSGSLVSGDSFTGALTRVAGETVAESPYAINQGTLALSTNYALTFVGNSLAITARPITVTADPKTKVYGDADPALTYQMTAGSLVSGDSFTGALTRVAGETVAESPYAINQGTLALSTNYALTFAGNSLAITARPITVTADPKTKVYGDADPALTYQMTAGSLVTGDSLSGSLTRVGGESVAGSPYVINQGSVTAGSNYALTFVGSSLAITKKAASVSAVADTKVYGSADPTFATTKSGFLVADTGAAKITFSASRAPGETVGGSPYLITPSVSDGTTLLLTNYEVTYNTANFTITKKSASVSAVANTKVYGDADPALGTTDSGFIAADLGAGKITFSANRAPGETVLGSPYAITPSASDGSTSLLSNYDVTFHNAAFTITKKSASVSAVTNTKVYGEPDPTLWTTSSGFLATDLGAGKITFSASRAPGETVAGSSYLITPSASDGGTSLLTNYEVSYTTADFTITKRPASLSAVANTKVYGAGDPALETSDSGFVADDLGAGKITFSASRASGETVLGGPYTITPSASDGSTHLLDNYDVTTHNASFTITPKSASVSAVGNTKVYGSDDPALATNHAGFLDDDLGVGKITFSATRVAGEIVLGSPYTIAPSASDASTSLLTNYDVTYNAADFTITTKSASVLAVANGKVYGEDDPALETTPSGFLTEDLGVGKITFSASRASGETVLGGPYTITPSASDGGTSLLTNYEVSYTTADFTIMKRPASVSAVANTKVYGEPDPTLGTMNDGFLADDLGAGKIALSASRAPGETVLGGPYTITPSASDGSTHLLDNYAVTTHNASFTITPKSASVSAVGNTKVYGSDDPALATNHAGFLDDDLGEGKITFSASRALGETVAGSPYTITASASDGATSSLTNYVVTYTAAGFTVTPKSASVSAVANTKVYGSADPTLGTTPSGFLAEDLGVGKITFSASRASGETVDGSPYTITPSASNGGTSLLTNYDVTYNPAGFTITKRPASVSAVVNTKVYGDADPALAATNSGFLTDDLGAGKITFSASRAPGESVTGSPYLITPSASDGTTHLLDNYDVTPHTANFSITTKPITGNFTAQNKVYDGGTAASVTGRSLNGVVSVDAVSLDGGTATFENKNVATNKIVNLAGASLAGGDAGNYSLTSVGAAHADITTKPITGNFTAGNKVYNGTTSATVTGRSLNDVVSLDSVSLAGGTATFDNKNVGMGKIVNLAGATLSGGDAGNYELTSVGAAHADITKAPLTVTADNKTKVLHAANPVFTVTDTGFATGDDPTSLGGSLAFATNVPSPEQVGSWTITPSGLTSSNYTITFATGTFKIAFAAFDGFLQPINDTAHQIGMLESKFKAGQTIPAKFVIKDALGAVVQQIGNPVFSMMKLGTSCGATTPDTVDPTTPDTGTVYTWDGSQYHYNWSTKGLATGEYRIYAALADGTKPYTNICLN